MLVYYKEYFFKFFESAQIFHVINHRRDAMTKKHHSIWRTIRKYIFLLAGTILAAAGLEFFLIPNNIIDGGIVGISIITSYLTKLPLGLFTFALNIPFLFFGYMQIGKTFVIDSLFSISSFSLWVSIFHPIPGLTNDILLATVFGLLYLHLFQV
jgi:uncharacterized membrane-anchored protein YitT (DUF2179 family)